MRSQPFHCMLWMLWVACIGPRLKWVFVANLQVAVGTLAMMLSSCNFV